MKYFILFQTASFDVISLLTWHKHSKEQHLNAKQISTNYNKSSKTQETLELCQYIASFIGAKDRISRE